MLRLRKLCSAFTSSLYAKALLHGVAPSIEHGDALGTFNFDLVIDVGANKGQFATFARHVFPGAQIVSFEPLEGPARIFEMVFRHDRRTKLIRAALGVERGSLAMYVTERDDSSSPLEVTQAQRDAFGTKVVERRDVPCGPLSDFIKQEDFGDQNLLKIDTQGYELEVLKGASSLLSRFAAIYCEVSYVELYKGQALAQDVISYLRTQEFHPVAAFNKVVSPHNGDLQADMLFTRAGSGHVEA
jgi:FkbM family methyltransferase